MTVLLKTPNFDYASYAITDFFYKYHEGKKVSNVKVFGDYEVEQIRKSIVAGELYQAIRRIARDTLDGSQIYILNNDQTIIDMVLQQLPSINYSKSTLKVNRSEEKKKKNPRKSSETPLKLEYYREEVKNILLKHKNTGTISITKKDVRNQVGITQSSNFAPILNGIKIFLEENNIIVKNKTFILNNV